MQNDWRNITRPPTMEPTSTPRAGISSSYAAATPNSGSNVDCQSNWQSTESVLQVALSIHVYGFAVVYVLTGIISLVRLYRLYTFRAGRLMSGYHFKMNMHISTLIFSVLRAVVLCLDPYGSRCWLDPLLISLLWSLAFPCLAVAFNSLLLVLLEATKLYLNLACIRHRTLTLFISTVLYTIVLVLKDVLVNYQEIAAVIFHILSLIIFFIWGLLMMLGYLYVAWKIRTNLRTSGSPIESEALRRFAGLLLACGTVGFLVIVAQVLSAVTEYGLKSTPEESLFVINPWAWWCLETAMRLLETAMSFLLIEVARCTDNKRNVQVQPYTNWDWPWMHGWNLETAPARPGRPIPVKPAKPGNSNFPKVEEVSPTTELP